MADRAGVSLSKTTDKYEHRTIAAGRHPGSL